MELRDKLGRRVTYLRLSVTDRCNLRCIYCIPEEGIDFTSHENILSLEDLAALAARFIHLFEIDKVRLTGGEPLSRSNIERLVEIIAKEKTLRDMAITTNGTALVTKSEPLFKAGLKRINVSLDSLDPEKYKALTGGGDIDRVLNGLEKARKVGFNPIKINTVLLPGFNEAEEFVRWADNGGYIVRFIEFMPPATVTRAEIDGEGPQEADILKILSEKIGPVKKIGGKCDDHGKIAQRYGFENNNMVFEIIPGTSEPFCDTCNRIRIDCQGMLRSCLYSSDCFSLKEYIDAPDDAFIEVVTDFIQKKTGRTLTHIGANMSSIGG